MKKLIFLFAFVFAVSTSIAQNQSPQVIMKAGTQTLDTVVNAATVNFALTAQADYTSISFQFVATKISGTVAGTVKLRGSNDGVDYFSVNTAATDTFTITDVATQTFSWTDTPGRYRFYQVNIIGSGTSTYSVKATAQPRRNY